MKSSILLNTALAAVALGVPVVEQNNAQVAAMAKLTGPPVAIAEDGNITIAPKSIEDTGTPVATSTASHQVVPSPFPSPVIRPDTTTDEEASKVEKRAPVATLYREAAVQRHNYHRANHGSGPVVWDATLAQAAMKSAKRCTFAHFMNENNLQYGQNLAIGNPAQNIAGIITDQWYNEVKQFKGNYGKAQPPYGTNMQDFAKWGHFTQVVWKGSTKIGCATWHCKSVKSSASDSTPLPAAYGGDVTYCNYQAPGNYGGQYAANIGKPKTDQTNTNDGFNVNQKAIAKSYGEFTGQKWA